MKNIIWGYAVFSMVLSLAAYGQAPFQGLIKNQEPAKVKSESYPYLNESQNCLDKAYNDLVKKMDDYGQVKLMHAQQAWLQYSEAQCDYKVNASAEEPLHQLTLQECLVTMNEERADDLQYELYWLNIMQAPDKLNGFSIDKQGMTQICRNG